MLQRLGCHACKHAPNSQVTGLTRRSRRLSARLVKVFSLLALIAQANTAMAGDLPGEPVDGIVDSNTRIIGGNKSANGEWPSVVALVSSRSGPSLFQRQFCAGTVIAPRWVLTAAHCMFDTTVTPARQSEPATLRVVAGVTDLNTPEPFTETVVVNVLVHPGYDPSSTSSPNDIALLELATDVQVPGIVLSGGEVAELVNVLAHIVGWGSISADTENPDFLPEQRDAAVPIVDHDMCNASGAYAGILVSSQMCAGFAGGGVDACAGDSGGPLIVEFQSGRAQVGVVSFGAGCAQPGAAGIYTDIAKFDDWIKSFVDIDISSRGAVKKRESGSGSRFVTAVVGKPAVVATGKQMIARNAGMLLATLTLVACMTTTSKQALNFAENTGRLGLAGMRLGDSRDEALAAVGEQLAVKPVCTARKVGLKDSRMAFLHETCEFEPTGVSIAGASVARVACHFISGRLQRIDLQASGDQATLATMQAEMEIRYGNAAVRTDDAMSLLVWQHGDDQAMLRRPENTSEQMIELQLIDAKMAERAPSLTSY